MSSHCVKATSGQPAIQVPCGARAMDDAPASGPSTSQLQPIRRWRHDVHRRPHSGSIRGLSVRQHLRAWGRPGAATARSRSPRRWRHQTVVAHHCLPSRRNVSFRSVSLLLNSYTFAFIPPANAILMQQCQEKIDSPIISLRSRPIRDQRLHTNMHKNFLICIKFF